MTQQCFRFAAGLTISFNGNIFTPGFFYALASRLRTVAVTHGKEDSEVNVFLNSTGKSNLQTQNDIRFGCPTTEQMRCKLTTIKFYPSSSLAYVIDFSPNQRLLREWSGLCGLNKTNAMKGATDDESLTFLDYGTVELYTTMQN